MQAVSKRCVWLNVLFVFLPSDSHTICLPPPQGKEIIEFYLKELEDEGITHVPRWTPSSLPLSPPRPASLSTNPPASPKLPVTPAVTIPLPADAKDSRSLETKQDSSGLQGDGLTEVVAAGTPEGLFLLRPCVF